MKFYTLIIIFLLFSCKEKKDVLLPKSNVSVVKDVQDHSPIYLFFKIKEKDTIAEINRKNSIISTNWIFNIDKRLPLKLVIPEVIKLQTKKREDNAHKNEKAQNYYSYADSIGKNLAFLPFTKVYYKLEKPSKENFIVYFKKGSNLILMGNYKVSKLELLKRFYSIKFEKTPSVVLLFDKNMSYQEYIENKILLGDFRAYSTNKLPEEFIY